MTCHFVLPFSVWWRGDEVTMQAKRDLKMEKSTSPNDAWKSYLKTWDRSMPLDPKNGSQQKCLDKSLRKRCFTFSMRKKELT